MRSPRVKRSNSRDRVCHAFVAFAPGPPMAVQAITGRQDSSTAYAVMRRSPGLVDHHISSGSEQHLVLNMLPAELAVSRPQIHIFDMLTVGCCELHGMTIDVLASVGTGVDAIGCALQFVL